MADALVKDFFELMNNFRSLALKSRQNPDMHQAEIMMLHAIESCMERECDIEDGVKISVLSDFLNITKPAASKMLNNMEQKNYICRKTDKRDRRVVYVVLTEEGKTILGEKKMKMIEFLNHLTEGVGEEDMKEFMRISKKMFRLMKEEYTQRKN